MGKATAIARLIRPANMLTALADVIAGWCIAGATGWDSLALLGGASLLLYGGGIALNDVCDAKLDARERPERVIPSGALTRGAAGAVAVLLLLTGVALSFVVSMYAGLIATGLVIAILLYDVWLKRQAVAGPVAMGLCRGLNLLLGMSAAMIALEDWWPVALLHMLYIGGVTAMARRESRTDINRAGPVICVVSLSATALIWVVVAFASARIDELWFSVFMLPFAILTAPAFANAAQSPSRGSVRRAVTIGILGLIALDAALAAGFASPVYGFLTFALLPAGLLIRRRFAVT